MKGQEYGMNEVYDILKDYKTVSDFKAALVKWEEVKCRCSNCTLRLKRNVMM